MFNKVRRRDDQPSKLFSQIEESATAQTACGPVERLSGPQLAQSTLKPLLMIGQFLDPSGTFAFLQKGSDFRGTP